MKKFRFLSVVCCLMMAASVASCLSDNDTDNGNNQYNGLTAAERAQCFTLVGGDYTGWLMYYNAQSKLDSVSVGWRVLSDSTMIVTQFPTEPLAANISYEPLRTSLLEQAPQPMNTYIGFVNTSPVEFLINPVNLSYNLHYSGEDHKVEVAFYLNTTYSFGTYDALTQRLSMQLVLGALYIDDKLSSYMSSNVPLQFYSTSKR